MDKASVRRAKIGWYRRLSSTGCTSLVLVLVLRATLNLNCISRDTSDIHQQQAILDIEMQYLMGQTKELVDEEQLPEKDWKRQVSITFEKSIFTIGKVTTIDDGNISRSFPFNLYTAKAQNLIQLRCCTIVHCMILASENCCWIIHHHHTITGSKYIRPTSIYRSSTFYRSLAIEICEHRGTWKAIVFLWRVFRNIYWTVCSNYCFSQALLQKTAQHNSTMGAFSSFILRVFGLTCSFLLWLFDNPHFSLVSLLLGEPWLVQTVHWVVFDATHVIFCRETL